jgi:hypothetical protein
MGEAQFDSPRTVTVVAKPGTGLRATRSGLGSISGFNVSGIESAVLAAGCSVQPMFGNEDRITAKVAALRKDIDPLGLKEGGTDVDVPDLSAFYTVEGPDDRLEELADKLRRSDGVAGAYVVEGPVPPVAEVSPINTVAHSTLWRAL